ncbi:MAG: GNAT family N-acetyltransferase, partial [Oscillospiraceae bacterium]
MSVDILNVKSICTQKTLLDLLSESVYNPTPERVLSRAENYQNNTDVEVYAYREDEKSIGIIVFEIDKNVATIHNISVKISNQRKGVGSQLIDFIFKRFNVIRILAETDDDAIEFYKKYGFNVSEIVVKFGIERYMCLCENMTYHYNTLIDENNDPVHDPEPLREYMNKWDGQEFID